MSGGKGTGMNLSGEMLMAAGVGLLAIVALPLLAHAFTDLVSWEKEPVRAIGAAAVVMGCLGMCGLIWGPLLGEGGWLVSLLGLVLLKIGLGVAVVFVWRAFRPHDIAAKATTAILMGLLVLSLYLDLQTIHTDASYPVRTLGFRLGQVVTSLPFLWLGIESARAGRAVRRGEPTTASAYFPGGHFRAWSIASAVFFLECCTALAASMLEGPQWRSAIDGLRGLLYGAAAICVYRAFYAPILARRRAELRARRLRQS